MRRACPLFERAFASGDVSDPPHKEALLLLASGNPTLVPPSSFFPLRSPIHRSFTSIHIAISLFELECANSTPSDRLPLHGGGARRPLHFQFPAFFAANPPDMELNQFSRLYTTVCLSTRPSFSQYFQYLLHPQHTLLSRM